MAVTFCACGHAEDRHHPAGRCVVSLPPFLEEELPAWDCPCRRFVASGVTSLLLRSVQSCTVGAAPRVPDQRIRATYALADVQTAHGRRLGLVRRTRA